RTQVAIVVSLAGKAPRAVEQDRSLFEADQGHQSAEKPMTFPKTIDFVDHAPAHQAEVAGVGRNRRVGDAVDYLVTEIRNQLLEPGFSLPAPALRHDDIKPFPPFGH